MMDWSAEDEVQLFFAMDGLRPVGVNKHFHIFCIAERLSKYLNRDVSADVIWKKLQSMYNLAALDKLEPLPFSVEEEFSLPDADFLVMKKRHEDADFLRRHDSDGSTSSGCPPSIIAVSDSSAKDKSSGVVKSTSGQQSKELDKKIACKLSEAPKRAQKRTRGSMSLESSPSTTPPPVQGNKRRRI